MSVYNISGPLSLSEILCVWDTSKKGKFGSLKEKENTSLSSPDTPCATKSYLNMRQCHKTDTNWITYKIKGQQYLTGKQGGRRPSRAAGSRIGCKWLTFVSSIILNWFQSFSIYFYHSQFISIILNLFQFISINLNWFQPFSTDFNWLVAIVDIEQTCPGPEGCSSPSGTFCILESLSHV